MSMDQYARIVRRFAEIKEITFGDAALIILEPMNQIEEEMQQLSISRG